MIVLGLTGGTGCGKTTALRAVKALGGLCLDCDEIYHELLETSRPLLQDIKGRFPSVVENGTLQRKNLGKSIYFSVYC